MTPQSGSIHIAFLCQMEPTPENGRNGASSLPFWTLRYAPENVVVDLCFLTTDPPEERVAAVRAALAPLQLRHVLAAPLPSRFKRKVGGLKALLKRLPAGFGSRLPGPELVREVKGWQPDIVWIYPNYWAGWLDALRPKFSVITGPDAESLWVERALEAGTNIYHKEISLQTSRRMDRLVGLRSTLCHVVGEEDRLQIERCSKHKDQTFFVPHPHAPVTRLLEPIDQVEGKLTVLISGGGKGFARLYTGEYLPRLVQSLVEKASGLKDGLRIRMVGRGYEDLSALLVTAGYEVRVDAWIEDYPAMLTECQVQVFPIQVGSGTKGKILQAMGSGLLAVGTKIAMENIHVQAGEEFLFSEVPEEVPALLAWVLSDRSAAARIAESGRQAVLKWHSPEYCAGLFWGHVLKAYAKTDSRAS